MICYIDKGDLELTAIHLALPQQNAEIKDMNHYALLEHISFIKPHLWAFYYSNEKCTAQK